jgi:acetylornithine deacetylase
MHKKPDLIEMIDGLISAPSVSSVNADFDQGNRLVIDRLANWLDSLGYHVEIMPLPGQPDKANLIATLGSGPGGLVLAGHTDTVPWDEGRWNFDPFQLTQQGNRLYGLGTSDMKAFLALAIEAASQFDATQFREPLILVATADEESSMAGARALVDAKRPQARYAVIGEPTGLRPVRLHKGILMEAIHLRGQSGHSSDPSLGNSALEGMHSIIKELISWRTELQTEHRNPLFEVPVPTLNLGHIHGGDNPIPANPPFKSHRRHRAGAGLLPPVRRHAGNGNRCRFRHRARDRGIDRLQRRGSCLRHRRPLLQQHGHRHRGARPG